MAESEATAATPVEEESGAIATVRVLLPLPLAEAYDYAVPEGLDLAPGELCRGAARPAAADRRGLGAGQRQGRPAPAEAGAASVRPAAAAGGGAQLHRPGRALHPVAAGRGAAHGPVLDRGAGAAEADHGLSPGRTLPPEGAKLSAARRRVLAVLEDGPPRLPAELAREAGCGSGVIKGMAEAGLLETVLLPGFDPVPQPDLARPRAVLGDGPARGGGPADRRGRRWRLFGHAAGRRHRLGQDRGLFRGGRRRRCAAGRQVLVLLPEIALSAQWLDRFAARFGVAAGRMAFRARPAAAPAQLAGGGRRRGPRRGRRPLGAVPALSRSRPDRGRRGARERLQAGGRRRLPGPRHGGGARPSRRLPGGAGLGHAVAGDAGQCRGRALRRAGAAVAARRRRGCRRSSAIDMRRESPPRGRFLSPPLREAVVETLAAGEQAMLFLNRRGYAPADPVPAAAAIAWNARTAPPGWSSTAWPGGCDCHHCGHRAPLPKACPSCHAEGSFAACGPGVERIAEEVDATLPGGALADRRLRHLLRPAGDRRPDAPISTAARSTC